MTSRQEDHRGLGRRRFLTTAALSGATIIGATALGGIDADAAFAAEPSLDPAIAKSSFVEGRITGITGSILEVAGSYGDHARVQMTNATSVWKVRATSAAAIEIGDGLYARGVPMPDGTIAADAVWVNIVNLDTQIRGIAKNRLHLAHGQHEVVGNVLPATTNASYAGRALTSDLSQLRIGQSAQVLGAWRPSDNSVDVVRISVGH
ncbi:cell wall protein [Streptomyces scopuliridis]|uniref:Cell wall protein n=1 Tax=Streptomyces scopuliridis TaxID=452529 RepID=A0ACD4ZVG9_9ACTN|nr:cell wall protein [Streptomyces scopuliridis]WSB37946.1 cell wall protein [Streptomyces scopuliridis]WSC02399.1 cell wall protein [Streptomyces scopuliridis]WSC04065.1 cell wall protein [Streptomyces scopuliridis]